MKISILILIPVSITLSACSTLTSTVLNASLLEKDIETGEASALGMTAERRLAIFKPNGDSWHICAEAQPDVAKTNDIVSSLEAAAEAVGQGTGNATLSESVEENLEIIYSPSEISDKIRQYGFLICQAHMNDALDEGQYYDLLKFMIEKTAQN